MKRTKEVALERHKARVVSQEVVETLAQRKECRSGLLWVTIGSYKDAAFILKDNF